MPSGSHGGGGGSHSSGGSSRGGSWGGSGGSSYSRSPRPMNIHFFGRHYYISAANSSRVTAFMSAIMICVFFLIIAFVCLWSYNSSIEKIKVDRIYYLDMIEKAENDSEYVKDGVVTDKFYNRDCKKWYFTYTIMTDSGLELEGYTYSVYTREEINQIEIGQHMQFAVNSKVVTLNTDSINMGYKNIPLESDGEFISFSNMKTGAIVVVCIISALIVLFIVLTILRIKKYAQKSALAEADQKNLSEGETYCKYCGSRIRKGEDKCQHCGASNIIKK